MSTPTLFTRLIRFTRHTRLAKALIFALSTLLFSQASMAELKLEPKMIEQWIASQKELARWGEQHEAQISRYEDSEQIAENPFELSAATMLTPLKKAGLYKEAEAIVSRYGFSSLETWAEANLVIAKTAAAIEVENTPEMLDPGALKSMLENADLPAEQKALLENAMAHNLAMLENLRQISSSQKDAIRPYLDRIIQLMDE